MPVSADRTVEGITVAHFFDNLLPDSGAITHPDMNSATAFLMNPGWQRAARPDCSPCGASDA